MASSKLSILDSKALEHRLRGLIYTSHGNPLTREDSYRCANALCLWALCIYDISVTYGYERTYSLANLTRWLGQRVDIADLNDSCKEILLVIRDYDPAMGRSGFRAYKAWLHQRLESNVLFEYLKPLLYLLYKYNTAVFRDLNTILQFWARLTLIDLDWVIDDTITTYLKDENEMSQWYYEDTLLSCLRHIITNWFSGFCLDETKPKFSNGATAETRRGAGIAAKILRGHKTSDLIAADAMISYHTPYFRYESTEPCSVYRLVPKGVDKKRSICMEPVVNQYYQMALFDAFDRWFTTHPDMKIDLHDQTISQNLCKEGSLTTDWSTIDISNASDSVTFRLVTELFRDCPEILRYITLVRTNYADVYGERVQLAKFVPMGSSICFPMECIVFAAIASYSCCLAGIPLTNYRVYGDDIVIDARAYHYCMETLERCHFTPNYEKSYGPHSHFLEACGMEAVLGDDVTPYRLSRRYNIEKARQSMSPQQLDCLIDLTNRAYAYGLFNMRRFLISEITSLYDDVPFSVDPERGIYHPNPSNTHLRGRWNSKTQQFEVLVTVHHSACRKGDDDIRYHLTLEAIDGRQVLSTPDDRVEIRCGSTRDSLRKEWVSSWIFEDNPRRLA